MNAEKIPYKIYLNENEMPKAWYNLRADMKQKPAPLLNPATLKPMKAEELEGVFCRELVAQELDNDTQKFLQNVSSVSAGPRILSGRKTGYAGQNLLQI